MVRNVTLLTAGLLVYVLSGACSDAVVPGARMVVLTESAVETEVAAADGATLEADTGHTLVIPPGALPEDTIIRMTPFRFTGGDGLDVLAGVELLPHGLVLDEPATLTMPLAVPGETDEGYRLLSGDELGQPSSETGDLFVADAGGAAASGDIWNFSCKYIMKNCHAYTRDSLFNGWEGVTGYDELNIQDRVGLSILEMRTCEFSAAPLNRMLLAYFAQCGIAEPGTQLSAASLDAIRNTLDEGRQVVVTFRMRGIKDPFPLSGVKHSGIVFERGGEFIVRSHLHLSIDQFELLHERGDSLILEEPLAELTSKGGLRDLVTGEVGRVYVEQKGLFPDDQRDPNKKPRVWGYMEAWCENDRAELPNQATLPNPVLRCTGGGGDQDRCDAMCDGGFRGTTVTATKVNDACSYRLEFDTKPGASFMFAFRGEGRWEAMQVDSGFLATGFNTDRPLDMIMGLYFDGTCPGVWMNVGCCFSGTCGPSAGCTPDPAEVGISSQIVPLVECDP